MSNTTGGKGLRNNERLLVVVPPGKTADSANSPAKTNDSSSSSAMTDSSDIISDSSSDSRGVSPSLEVKEPPEGQAKGKSKKAGRVSRSNSKVSDVEQS